MPEPPGCSLFNHLLFTVALDSYYRGPVQYNGSIYDEYVAEINH